MIFRPFFRSARGILGYIAEDSIREVAASADIVELVSGYIPLKRKGNSWWAPCPFHDEKTASFHVVPERQMFKCFGCGVGGGAIKFVQLFDKLEFPAAVEMLAEKAGIVLRYEGGRPDGPGREALLRVLDWAADVFRKNLQSPEGAAARDLLAKRGVSDETAETWRLGYALESWDALLQRALKNGFDERTLLAAGLIREGSRGRIDWFRNRLMFPIFDVRGKVIAFAGRVMNPEDQPKFINSPDSVVFNKRRNFYGLHRAREESEDSRTLAVVEGYLDVIVPWQAGVRGLVAAMGTALTPEHLKLLKRHADRVVLVFDSDAAGRRAAEKGLDLLVAEDVDLFVAELPPGEDADDVVAKRGADALRGLLARPREVFGFLVDSLASKIDTTTPNGKAKLVNEVMERIAVVPNPVKQDFLVKEVVARFGVDEKALRARLRREEPPPAPKAAPAAPKGLAAKAARELLSLLANDAPAAAAIRAGVPLEGFPEGPLREAAALAYGLLDRTGALKPADLLALVTDPAAGAELVEALEAPHDPATAARRLEDCLEVVRTAEYRTKTAASDRPTDDAALEQRARERAQAPKNLRSLPRAPQPRTP